MSDVKPVGSPGSGPEPARSKKDRASDPQGFKEAYSKVEKVEETHEDQPKKKRASKGEEDDDMSVAETGAPTPPSKLFSLEPETPKDSLVIGPSTKQTFSSPKQPGPAAAPLYTPPDADLWEEQSSDEVDFTPPQAPQTPQTTPPPAYTPSNVGPPPANQPQSLQPQNTQSGPPQTSSSQKTPGTSKAASSKATSSQQAPLASPKIAKEGSFKPVGSKEKSENNDEETQGMTMEGLASPPISRADALYREKTEKKVSDASVSLPEGSAALSLTPSTMQTPPASATPAPYIYLHPTVLEYFERSVSTITVMMSTGVTETTVSLHEQSNSIFAGAKITIREFSTAPKAFNIEFTANPEAVAIFQSNVDDLMAAFQSGGYNFKVNRIETRIGRPLVRRKEAHEK
jgi:hypothetical protein